MDHYEGLGVGPTAARSEIRAAYVAWARLVHPDLHRDAGDDDRRRAARRMIELNEAWRVLGDPARRRIYDRGPAGPAPRAGGDAPGDGTGPSGTPTRTPGSTAPGGRSNLVALVPVGLLAAALSTLVVGLVLGGPVLALGALLFGLAMAAFLVAPFLALATSRQDRSSAIG